MLDGDEQDANFAFSVQSTFCGMCYHVRAYSKVCISHRKAAIFVSYFLFGQSPRNCPVDSTGTE